MMAACKAEDLHMHGNGTDKDEGRPQKGFENGIAVVVGISTYRDVNLDLPVAVQNDAHDVYHLLTDPEYCGYNAGRVQLLTNEAATRQAMRKALRWLADEARPDDTAIVYFSGHGHRRFLMPWDARQDQIESSCFGDTELHELLEQVKASRVLLLLDACHAASLAGVKGFRRGPGVELSVQTYELLGQGKGRAVFAAALADQKAYVWENERNSVFTGALLEGLRGGAHSAGPVISLADLFKFMGDEIKARGCQTPFFKFEAEIDFPIALALRAAAPSDDNWAKLADLAAELYVRPGAALDAWESAGGDPARLYSNETPQVLWRSAIKLLRSGGGGGASGRTVGPLTLLAVIRRDYPDRVDLPKLEKAFGKRPPPPAHGDRHGPIAAGGTPAGLVKRGTQPPVEEWSDDSWRQRAIEYALSLGADVRNAAASAQADRGEGLIRLAKRQGQAITWQQALCKAAAAFGSTNAHFELGNLAFYGEGTVRSDHMAEVWHRRGAALGEERCMYMLFEIFKSRAGTESSAAARESLEREANAWLIRAAEASEPFARYELARRQIQSGDDRAYSEACDQLRDLAADERTPLPVRNKARDALVKLGLS